MVNTVICPAVVVRAATYAAVGPYCADFTFAVDWGMWLRIELASWSIAYIATLLLRYRVHARRDTNRFQESGEDLRHA